MKIVFATHNNHKLNEVRQLLPMYEVVGLTEIGLTEEIEENGQTLEENAKIKAQYVFNKTGLSCFADDTGLEVEALNREPGVHTARYAGEQCDANANMKKLLKVLEHENNRKARFRTVICLISSNEKHYFEGTVNGIICKKAIGDCGFGYDPIFKADGYEQTFAQMNACTKNSISHRGQAVKKLIDFLNQ